ncbi:MAG TPA: hypothetical protein VF042_14775 [Gemmatimonadaceae bacterium]
MSVPTRLLSLAAVALVAACSTKDASSTADSARNDSAAVSAAPAAANVVEINASEYKFEAPDQIPAGLTTFKMNDTGKELHHATLVKLDSGKTFNDLMEGMKQMKPGTPPPGWAIPAGGPNAAAPGSTSALTTVLQPGNYAIVCFIPDAKGVPHVAHGMAKALTVTPNPNANMSEPSADITVTLKDYQFDFSQPLTAGKHTLKFVTAPGQPHEFTFFMLQPGRKAEDIPKFVETGMQGPPPGLPLGGVAAMGAGQAAYYEVDLKPGDYAIVCFLEDAKDGKPHFMHGMIQQIKIS